MKSNFTKILFLFLIFIVSIFSAQKRTEDFQISIPDNRSIKSSYKKINLIDVRPDTTNIGIIQKGAFNTKARVIPSVPLKTQIQNLLTSIVSKDSGDGELLLYLKQFYFAEVTGAMSEKGYCYLQAYLFSKNDEGKFQLLDKVDSVIVHSSMDVTKATMKKGSELISNFIIKNAYQKKNTNDSFTYEQVKNYDKIVKQDLPLYNNDKLRDGLYVDFKNFKEQNTSEVSLAKIKTTPDGSKAFKIFTNADGKEKEIRNKSDYYAIVFEGIPYIYSNMDHAFTRMEKNQNDGDFYFKAKAKATAKTGNVIAAAAFFGIIGGLIAADANSEFEMKLDYLNGGFIPIKEADKK